MSFKTSDAYWRDRYDSGRTSGKGSYGALAQVKADFLNGFVAANAVRTVVEFGCGDGNQLRYASYEDYTGYDISPAAVALCRDIFASDPKKAFFELTAQTVVEPADLALSLDVIYHLVEDQVFERHVRDVFGAARKFVIIYSSNRDQVTKTRHVRHRELTTWIAKNVSGFDFVGSVENPARGRVDADGERITTPADFYVYARTGAVCTLVPGRDT